MTDWTKTTMSERRDRRDELSKTGSLWQSEDKCGDDLVACGVCDECVDNGTLDSLTE